MRSREAWADWGMPQMHVGSPLPRWTREDGPDGYRPEECVYVSPERTPCLDCGTVVAGEGVVQCLPCAAKDCCDCTDRAPYCVFCGGEAATEPDSCASCATYKGVIEVCRDCGKAYRHGYRSPTEDMNPEDVPR